MLSSPLFLYFMTTLQAMTTTVHCKGTKTRYEIDVVTPGYYQKKQGNMGHGASLLWEMVDINLTLCDFSSDTDDSTKTLRLLTFLHILLTVTFACTI